MADVSVKVIRSMKVAAMRSILDIAGLSSVGKKDELQIRLITAVEEGNDTIIEALQLPPDVTTTAAVVLGNDMDDDFGEELATTTTTTETKDSTDVDVEENSNVDETDANAEDMIVGASSKRSIIKEEDTVELTEESASPNNIKDDQKKIFIGGLAPGTTEEQVRAHFSQYGEVSTCELIVDPHTQRLRGYAFLNFEDPSCTVLVKEGKHCINNKDCDVRLSTGNRLKQISSQRDMSCRVYVGGLGNNVPEVKIREHFAQYGDVNEVVMPIGPGGKLRGFAFVVMSSAEQCNAALVKPRQLINGLPCDVRKAEVRPKQRYQPPYHAAMPLPFHPYGPYHHHHHHHPRGIYPVPQPMHPHMMGGGGYRGGYGGGGRGGGYGNYHQPRMHQGPYGGNNYNRYKPGLVANPPLMGHRPPVHYGGFGGSSGGPDRAPMIPRYNQRYNPYSR